MSNSRSDSEAEGCNPVGCVAFISAGLGVAAQQIAANAGASASAQTAAALGTTVGVASCFFTVPLIIACGSTLFSYARDYARENRRDDTLAINSEDENTRLNTYSTF